MRLSPIYSRFLKLLAIALLTNQFMQPGAIANPSTPEPVNSPTSTAPQNSPKALVEEVWQIVERAYIDGKFNQQDWNAIRQRYLNRSYGSYEEAYQAIGEMLNLLGDPLTRFLDPLQFKNLQVSSSDVVGIGLELTKDRETQAVTIIQPIENSPAQKAGILPQDIITAIDGKPVEKKIVSEVVTMLMGKVGTSVTLDILRSGKPITFRVQRANIEIIPVRYRTEETAFGRIGYIRLNQFSAKAAQEMKGAIGSLEAQNVKGYVLDLRSNQGGLFFASIDISRMWLDRGIIMSTIDRNGIQDHHQANHSALTQKPLVILVNRNSASASEIVAAALQENKRASLVGTRTEGYNSIQSVRGLSNGSGLAVTIAKWLTPTGRDINRTGLNPDVVVELTDRQQQDLFRERKIGTTADPQFVKALQILNQKLRPSR
ncbi:S41 family peptidase [Microcoleus sp. D2_18a_D3]|uniref:S41 family peptidase n=1 Tax=Microcoleus sp. D2_18a_D3 TaxID=3055330 RepID=UPI002FD0460A